MMKNGMMSTLLLGLSFTGLLKLTAVLTSGFYVHGCLFMSLIEHPSRRNLPVAAFVQQWRQSCYLTKIVFLSVENMCLLSSILLYFMDPTGQEFNYLWLIAAGGVLANMAWTITQLLSDIKRTTEENVETKKDYQWIARTVDSVMRRHNFRILVALVVHLTVLRLSCLG